MTGMTKHSSSEDAAQARGHREDSCSAGPEGSAMQWNGRSGVREYRAAPGAEPDSRAPDEEPRRVCIGEICEPLS